jgi:aerobic-type carbon monoxide dehydrogenase small subunit (CoxS/CutS family)
VREHEDDACPTDGATKTTRREFLAYSAAGVAVSALPIEAGAAAPVSSPEARSGRQTISLKVNGKVRRVEVDPGATLAEVLRERLGLTGTKVGCDRGACSACTVLLDGAPISSCMTFALDVGSREVTTIEGLASARGLTKVQEAFIAHDAMQCGFCTPGLVLTAFALLARNPRPTLDEVKEATSGNLCRCGSYSKVFEAVLSVGGAAVTER